MADTDRARPDPTLPPWPESPVRGLVAVRTWLATIHLLVGPIPATIAFTLVVTGVVLGIGLIPLALLGIPVLVGTVVLARGFANLERRRYALLLDEHIPAPAALPVDGSLLQKTRLVLTSAQGWRPVGYCLLALPLSIVFAVLANVVWSVPVALLAMPFLPDVAMPVRVIGPVVGLVLLTVVPVAIRLLAGADTAVARSMLGPRTDERLAGRVRVLEDSRARVVDSAEAERRRIERDLHDGAQQRLVSLAMTLGRAQARYDTDPDGARALLAEGQTEAKLALAELRDLTRGIHPPVLTDRGLDAALSGLAQRSPVPVTVEVDPEVSVDPRPGATVESIAYFVVAEALTNVAKHARARCVSVAVRLNRDQTHGDTLHLVVLDDGVGGASADRGTGLAGLADRIAGVDGRLTLDSPIGGPTVLSVELPCVS